MLYIKIVQYIIQVVVSINKHFRFLIYPKYNIANSWWCRKVDSNPGVCVFMKCNTFLGIYKCLFLKITNLFGKYRNNSQNIYRQSSLLEAISLPLTKVIQHKNETFLH